MICCDDPVAIFVEGFSFSYSMNLFVSFFFVLLHAIHINSFLKWSKILKLLINPMELLISIYPRFHLAICLIRSSLMGNRKQGLKLGWNYKELQKSDPFSETVTNIHGSITKHNIIYGF